MARLRVWLAWSSNASVPIHVVWTWWLFAEHRYSHISACHVPRKPNMYVGRAFSCQVHAHASGQTGRYVSYSKYRAYQREFFHATSKTYCESERHSSGCYNLPYRSIHMFILNQTKHMPWHPSFQYIPGMQWIRARNLACMCHHFDKWVGHLIYGLTCRLPNFKGHTFPCMFWHHFQIRLLFDQAKIQFCQLFWRVFCK